MGKSASEVLDRASAVGVTIEDLGLVVRQGLEIGPADAYDDYVDRLSVRCPSCKAEREIIAHVGSDVLVAALDPAALRVCNLESHVEALAEWLALPCERHAPEVV